MDARAKIKIGTCAWSFDEWHGVYYPIGLPHNRRLEFYSRYLNAVEVDSTFYHTPAPEVLGHWLDQTPETFCFTCKAPREITHELRLRDSGEKIAEFLNAIAPLRARLGCVLIQLPPSFKPGDDESALKYFVLGLPRDFRFAIEFRNPEWHLPRIVHLFEDRSICWVWSDMSPLDQQNQTPFDFLPQTTDFLYVRLMGDATTKYSATGETIHRYGRQLWTRDSAIESWALRIRRHLPQSYSAYLFANNHYEGFSPLTCKKLALHFGLETSLPNPDERHHDKELPEDQLELL
jgi:uncharacterized protein YecE (DUF72 family)